MISTSLLEECMSNLMLVRCGQGIWGVGCVVGLGGDSTKAEGFGESR
jgi:hypothetical protein